MPYFLRYRLLTGTVERVTHSAEATLKALLEIEEAGGHLVAVVDGLGKQIPMEQLELAAIDKDGDVQARHLYPQQ